MKKQNQGFSLIELIVVVGIISILALVAVPNLLKFQAKAKQTNAKTELASIYGLEKAYFTEYSTYSPDLPQLGFAPDGVPVAADGCPESTPSANWPQRYYNVGFAGGSRLGGGTSPCASAVLSFQNTVPDTTAIDLARGTTADGTGFTASAAGKVAGNAAVDMWSINENKQLKNDKAGL